MITFVVHSAGVNAGAVKLVPFHVQVVHQLNEYDTNVTGDGHAVFVILHVVLAVELLHTPLANVVHVNTGAVGALVSNINVFTFNILLWFHNASVTLIVQLLYVHCVNALNVIVLLHQVAVLVADAQLHPYVIVHDSVVLNV